MLIKDKSGAYLFPAVSPVNSDDLTDLLIQNHALWSIGRRNKSFKTDKNQLKIVNTYLENENENLKNSQSGGENSIDVPVPTTNWASCSNNVLLH